MTISDIYARVSPYFRKRRFNHFIQNLKPGKETRILDVGGHPACWDGIEIDAHITTLNIYPIEVPETLKHRFTAVVGDGTSLQFADGEFDIIYSNSVIEHLGSHEAQRRFASEIRRVGRSYYIQTPAKEFFMEPHYIAPFIHWFPPNVQCKVMRYGTVWGLMSKPDRKEIERVVAEIRLLTRNETANLFPEAAIEVERDHAACRRR